jgi:hypothetical protein
MKKLHWKFILAKPSKYIMKALENKKRVKREGIQAWKKHKGPQYVDHRHSTYLKCSLTALMFLPSLRFLS